MKTADVSDPFFWFDVVGIVGGFFLNIGNLILFGLLMVSYCPTEYVYCLNVSWIVELIQNGDIQIVVATKIEGYISPQILPYANQ